MKIQMALDQVVTTKMMITMHELTNSNGRVTLTATASKITSITMMMAMALTTSTTSIHTMHLFPPRCLHQVTSTILQSHGTSIPTESILAV